MVLQMILGVNENHSVLKTVVTNYSIERIRFLEPTEAERVIRKHTDISELKKLHKQM